MGSEGFSHSTSNQVFLSIHLNCIFLIIFILWGIKLRLQPPIHQPVSYSTAQKYFSANSHYSFRKFLLSSVPAIRMLGIKESVFINYLATPLSKNYTELGYSIDGIFRSFRLEGVFSFQNLTYRQFGFRIGFSPSSFIQFQKED